ncbi:MAG: ABC transporter permease [Dysgonamonadaceae bacterium]|jgi:ABC-type antimicrobial peptide transport system permease subunit|nr:ABC transporter permease [Dysgonamonadaceae bacterium]
MINHLFKLAWNRKKAYTGIFIEQALIAIILMFSTVKLMETLQKVSDPGLLDTKNTISYGNDFRKTATPEGSIRMDNHLALAEHLRKMPFVEAITNSYGLTPFFDRGKNRISDSIRIDGKKIKTDVKGADKYSAIVFRIKMQEGTWLEDKTFEDGSFPAVITRQFVDSTGWTMALGKKFPYKARTYTVVGVVEGIKDNLFEPSKAAVILPVDHLNRIDMAVARVRDKERFINALNKESNRLYSEYKNTLLVAPVDMMKQAQIFSNAMELILISIPVLFLTVFAFIGVFGVFNLQAKKHFREFALRIALGATKWKLMGIVIGESLLINALASMPALLLSFLIYDYSAASNIIGVFTSIGVMLLFSVISAWYPAWTVSRVNPAEALQYE